MEHSHSPLTTLALDLVRIPSETGHETQVLEYLEKLSQKHHLATQRFPVDQGRFNLLIHPAGVSPELLLSTHIDTVPGGPAPEIREGRLLGRGSCDAKGIAASMWFALQDLLASGERRVGLLFVVGEETCSDGAKAMARQANAVRYIINGEPTDLAFVAAQKGVVAGRLSVRGVSAHSGYPHLGRSAIHELLDILSQIRATPWPANPQVGETLVNVGVIAGGSAPNVLAETAFADLMFRVATTHEEIIAKVQHIVGERGVFEVRTASAPQILHVPNGEPSCVVGFGSDVAHLRPLAQMLMMGPGSILDAHTDHESVKLADLEIAREKYARIATQLLTN